MRSTKNYSRKRRVSRDGKKSLRGGRKSIRRKSIRRKSLRRKSLRGGSLDVGGIYEVSRSFTTPIERGEMVVNVGEKVTYKGMEAGWLKVTKRCDGVIPPYTLEVAV